MGPLTEALPAPALALVCGVGAGLGLFLIAGYLFPGEASGPDRDGLDEVEVPVDRRERARRWRLAVGESISDRVVLRWLLTAGAGLLVGAITRWPVAALLGAVGAWSLPALLRNDSRLVEQVARLEAIATWTEMLRDTIASAAGLEQAIAAGADAAPHAIRPQVQALQERLRKGQRLPEALRSFASEVADPSCDLVVASLVMASQRQARQLGDLLSSLAAATRDQVAMRLRIAAARARTQTSVRVIVVTTVTMALGLAVLDRSYLAPYNSLSGQVVLLLIGGIFACGLAWLRKIAAFTEAPRVLTRLDAFSPSRSHAGPDERAGISAR